MITDEEIVGTALDAGFMLSTQYGQAENKQMPVSDTATLRDFAQRFYQLGRQHQRESDAALCKAQADRSNASGEKEREFGSKKTAHIYFDTATGAEFCHAAILANTGELK